MSHPDWRAAREALLLRLVREQRASERADAAEQLCDIVFAAPVDARAEFIPLVAQLIADKQDDVRSSGLALGAMVLPEAEAQDLFTRHLSDKQLAVRIEAAGRLADLESASARGALAAALNDEAFPVRFEAARGMALLKHSAGFEVLSQALVMPDFRFRAAAALAHLGNPDAVAPLQRAFRGWFVPTFDRTQLAGALATFKDAEGVAHLFKRAAKSWSVDRAMAVEMLGSVNAPGAKERLLAIVSDAKDTCRGAAARGLGALGDVSVSPTLESLLVEAGLSDDVRLDVAEGLLALKTPNGVARVKALSLTSPEAKLELEEMIQAYVEEKTS